MCASDIEYAFVCAGEREREGSIGETLKENPGGNSQPTRLIFVLCKRSEIEAGI